MLIILSGFLMTTQLGIVRLISEEISVFEIILFRSLFGLIAISPVIAGGFQIYLKPNRPGLAILCGEHLDSGFACSESCTDNKC